MKGWKSNSLCTFCHLKASMPRFVYEQLPVCEWYVAPQSISGFLHCTTNTAPRLHTRQLFYKQYLHFRQNNYKMLQAHIFHKCLQPRRGYLHEARLSGELQSHRVRAPHITSWFPFDEKINNTLRLCTDLPAPTGINRNRFQFTSLQHTAWQGTASSLSTSGI